jgi:transposase
VGDVVASLDLRAIEETYTEERGYPPYHPRMMVTLLLYACWRTSRSAEI